MKCPSSLPGWSDVLSLRIAARFLKSSPGQSLLIMAGIAVGIATQIFVGSLITSLQADLIDSAVGSSAHITLLPGDGETIDRALASDASASEDLISTAVPVRTLSGIFVDGEDSVPLSITGGDAARLDTIYGLSDRMAAGSFRLGEGEAVVGTVFAEKYGVGTGDGLDVLLPSGSPATFEVSGVFDLGQATRWTCPTTNTRPSRSSLTTSSRRPTLPPGSPRSTTSRRWIGKPRTSNCFPVLQRSRAPRR
jgi:lipoprotein-releasing system permease protein